MTVGAILTLGLGTFSDVNHVVTLGYGTGATPPTPTVVSTNTPGRIRRLGKTYYRGEEENEKLARRIREGTIPAPVEPPPAVAPTDDYAKKSARLAAGIAKLRAESDRHRKEIERLERARETAKLRRELLLAQQALQLATVQEAVLLEEMEVLDIAFFAHVALRMVLQ